VESVRFSNSALVADWRLPSSRCGGCLAAAKTYPRGSIIFSEGDQSDYLLVILKGRVKVLAARQGPSREIGRHLERADFAERSQLIARRPRSATVIARDAPEVLEIARAVSEAVSRKQPIIAMKS